MSAGKTFAVSAGKKSSISQDMQTTLRRQPRRGHVGNGIGDTDRNGLSGDEKLVVSVEGQDINEISFELDGLGGRDKLVAPLEAVISCDD